MNAIRQQLDEAGGRGRRTQLRHHPRECHLSLLGVVRFAADEFHELDQLALLVTHVRRTVRDCQRSADATLELSLEVVRIHGHMLALASVAATEFRPVRAASI